MDTPQISNYAYSGYTQLDVRPDAELLYRPENPTFKRYSGFEDYNKSQERRVQAKQELVEQKLADIVEKAAYPKEKEHMATRLVRIIVIDTNENIPVEKRILFKSDEKVTDSTDQELFFEIGIMELLEQHNEYRTTVIDKKASKGLDKEVLLEAVKIRELQMVVIDIARF